MKVSVRKIGCSISEVAYSLGISKTMAYQLARERRIPTFRFGRRVIVPWDILCNMIAKTDCPKWEFMPGDEE